MLYVVRWPYPLGSHGDQTVFDVYVLQSPIYIIIIFYNASNAKMYLSSSVTPYSIDSDLNLEILVQEELVGVTIL